MGINIRYKTFVKSWMMKMGLGTAFKNIANEVPAKAGALGLAAFMTFSMAANAENKNQNVTDTSHASTVSLKHTEPAFVQAGDYGEEHMQNVGIVVYYGKGNGNTPDEIGNYVANKVAAAAEKRDGNVDPKYFVTVTDGDAEGVAIAYHMGNTSLGPVDIRDAITDQFLNDVLDKREASARLLASNSL